MPRKLRIQYPGAMHDLMNRGDQREPIFQDDEDRQKFEVDRSTAAYVQLDLRFQSPPSRPVATSKGDNHALVLIVRPDTCTCPQEW